MCLQELPVLVVFQVSIFQDGYIDCSFAAMNQPEIIEKPFGSRKDYMDSLTAYGMADYMAGEYRRQNLKASLLSNPSDLEKWLLEKVDIKGYPIEDPREA